MSKFAIVLAAAAALPGFAVRTTAAETEIVPKEVTIWSDGTRMVGDLYLPPDHREGQRHPAIVYAAGTSGTRKSARRVGPIFARDGYVVLGFSYRGWGDSDGIITTLEPQPKPDESGEMTVRVRVQRWQINYADQTEDIRAAISYLAGDPAVDPQRIGILGTSYGGGLVTWTAAHDPRIKAAAAQVGGGMGPRGDRFWPSAYTLNRQQARGETEPVPFETGKASGRMSRYSDVRYNSSKSIGFDNEESAEKIQIPMLIIDAEKDELIDISKSGGYVAKRLKERGVPVEYHVLPGMTHYSVYREEFEKVTKLELDFFNRYLKSDAPQATP